MFSDVFINSYQVLYWTHIFILLVKYFHTRWHLNVTQLITFIKSAFF